MRTTIRSAGNRRPDGVLLTLHSFGVGCSGDAGKASLGTGGRISASGYPLRPNLGECPFHALR
jgi:hypothetical protein